ncbi:MAG TPA: response regulator [Candidatus Methanofastidiosa archaeon]|nr:response regulator [Candidatus Methanofastidiosa archaeon]
MASILVVDDEEDIRFIFTKILSSKGYSVEAAENCSVALEKFNSKRPDLVIMDSKLPDMDGLDVTRNIIEIDPDAKIIGATGYSNLTQAFKDVGAIRVLAKPFSLEELVNVVSEVLEE